MKFINHLTKEEINGVPSRALTDNILQAEVNNHIIIPEKGRLRYYLITGYVIDTPNYYVLYEITKSQYDKRLKIHEILV